MKLVLFLCCFCFCCSPDGFDNTIHNSLTVEGYIEPGKYARIYLTKNLPVIGTIDSLDLVDSIETTAKVELFSENTSEILTLKKDLNRFPFFYYRSNIISGDINKNYTLKISLNNSIYNAETTIPSQPIIESYNFENTKKDSLRKLSVSFKKQLDLVGFYKCFIKHNNDDVYTKAKPFIFNDSLVISNTYTVSFLYDKIVDNEIKNQMKVGDTIEFKISSIPKTEYEFWKAIVGDQTTLNNDVLFTQNTPTNIFGAKAFGYWSGQNSQKTTIIVK